MSNIRQNVARLAESFVRIPSFALAYGAFAKIYENEQTLYSFRSEVLSKLFDMCLHLYSSRKLTSNLLNPYEMSSQDLMNILTCTFCKSILFRPVVLYCGHTFCRKCVESHPICHNCSSVTKVDDLSDCVILSQLLERFFPDHLTLCRRLVEAKDLFDRGQYDEGSVILSELLTSNPGSYLCMHAKAEAAIFLCDPCSAIQVIDRALAVQTSWPKLYCIKGLALNKLNRPREAIEYFFKSFTMYPHCERLRTEMRQIFDEIFTDRDIKLLMDIVETWATKDINEGGDAMQMSDEVKELIPITFWMKYSPSLGLYIPIKDDIADIFHPTTSKCSKLLYDPSCVFQQFDISHRATNQSCDLRDEFRCALCLRILLWPLTPSCGHTFCRECLEQSLDYKPECPLCKSSMISYMSSPVRGVNYCVTNLVNFFMRDDVFARQQSYKAELAIRSKIGVDPQYDVPILIGYLAIPGYPCPLHIFEPHYRGMVRRAIASGSRRFGVFSSRPSSSGLADVGTILQIRSAETLSDGRFLLDTRGFARIRVISENLAEGCITIRFEYYKDFPLLETEKEAFLADCSTVHSMASCWLSQLPCSIRASIVPFFGILPNIDSAPPEGEENGPPAWVWWLIAVLPINENCKYVLFSCQHPQIRMKKLKNILTRLVNRGSETYPYESLSC